MRRAITALVLGLGLLAGGAPPVGASIMPADATVYWSCGAWQPAPLPVVAPGQPLPILTDACA